MNTARTFKPLGTMICDFVNVTSDVFRIVEKTNLEFTRGISFGNYPMVQHVKMIFADQHFLGITSLTNRPDLPVEI